jgi:hypothetical protein
MLNEYLFLRQTPVEFRLAFAAKFVSGNETTTCIQVLQGQIHMYQRVQESLLSQYWKKSQQTTKLSIYQS